MPDRLAEEMAGAKAANNLDSLDQRGSFPFRWDFRLIPAARSPKNCSRAGLCLFCNALPEIEVMIQGDAAGPNFDQLRRSNCDRRVMFRMGIFCVSYSGLPDGQSPTARSSTALFGGQGRVGREGPPCLQAPAAAWLPGCSILPTVLCAQSCC